MIDREGLVRAIREKGIREELIVRVEEIKNESKSRVRVRENVGEEL